MQYTSPDHDCESMTQRRTQVLAAVYEAVEDINQQLADDSRLEKAEATAILGSASRLDSLNMLNLIVGIEEKLSQQGILPGNFTERLIEREDGPPETLGALATFILELQNT